LPLLLALGSCGGGGGGSSSPPSAATPPAACVTRLTVGFTGNLNATYPDAGGADGGGGDSGAAGVGGGEGKVLGAGIEVVRLADGALLAQGVTDSQDGLATLTWCRSDLPVMLTLSGAPGARYFDESVNALVDFPPGTSLRALVDRFDENVGVSSLTEAGVVWALNNVVGNPSAVAAGTAPLVTQATPVGLNSDGVRRANAAVLTEVNRFFTDSLQQASMKALPTPLAQDSASNALPANRYGRLAAVTGGFAKIAGSYNFNTLTPGLAFARQFAEDFSDGRIDGLRLDRRVAAVPGDRTFDKQTVSEAWTIGYGTMSQRFGVGTTLNDGENYTSEYFVNLGTSGACPGGDYRQGRYLLSKIGTVTVALQTPSNGACFYSSGSTTTYDTRFLTDVVSWSVSSGPDRIHAIRRDGSVWGWGRMMCGRLGNGVSTDSIQETPLRLSNLAQVVSVADAFEASIALTADGHVYSWGENYGGALGLGNGPFDVVCPDRRGSASNAPVEFVPSNLTPRRIPTLTDIKAITGSNAVSALRSDGRVYQWGRMVNEQGVRVNQSTPQLLTVISDVTKISSTSDVEFALKADGTVWGWGYNFYGSFADGTTTVKMPPKQVSNVAGVVDLVSDGFGSTVAQLADGRVVVWLGALSGSELLVIPPTDGAGYRRTDNGGTIPRAVRLRNFAGRAGFVGADGANYSFTFTKNPTMGHWTRSNFDGVPSPILQ
jgi:hypothetical protein